MTTNKNASKNTAKNNPKGTKVMANKNTEKTVKKPDAEKFTELANIRVPKALRMMKSIATLANDSRYEYNDEQTTAIVAALKSAIDDIDTCFKNGGESEDESFRI